MACKFSVVCGNYNANIPLYSFVGPSLERNHKSLRKICSFPFLDLCYIYSGLLGILGMCLSLIDIIRVVRSGSVLPSSLWRTRLETGKIVTPQCERDLKLISLVLSFEYYTLLVFGTFTDNPTMFVPWMILYTFIIIGEFVLFVGRLFEDGFNISKQGLLLSMFLIYNWLSVFCVFFRLVSGCSC